MRERRHGRSPAGLASAEPARRSGVAQAKSPAFGAGHRVLAGATSEKLSMESRSTLGESLREHRTAVIAVLERHHMTNPRVFGSAATATDSARSDIDLLVDARPGLDLLDLVDAADELEALLQVEIDLITSRSLRPDHPIWSTAVAI